MDSNARNIELHALNYAKICKNKNLSTINTIISGLEQNKSIDVIARNNCVSLQTVNTLHSTYNMIGGDRMIMIANNFCINRGINTYEHRGGAIKLPSFGSKKTSSSASITSSTKPKKTLEYHAASLTKNANTIATTTSNLAASGAVIGASVAGLLSSLSAQNAKPIIPPVQPTQSSSTIKIDDHLNPVTVHTLSDVSADAIKIIKDDNIKLQAEVKIYENIIAKMKETEAKYNDEIQKLKTQLKDKEDELSNVKYELNNARDQMIKELDQKQNMMK